MSLETPATPAPAVQPLPRSSEADIRAALAPLSSRLLPGAEPHLVKLLAAEFRDADPSLLAGAVAARIESPEYKPIFTRGDAPAPGSLEAAVAKVDAERQALGGTAGLGDRSKRIDMAGTLFREEGLRHGQEAAKTGTEYLAERTPAGMLNDNPHPPGSLAWFGHRYGQGVAARQASSGIVLRQK